MITYDQVQAFDRDGFVLVEQVFSQQEVAILLEQISLSERVAQRSSTMADAQERASKLSLWTEIGEDAFSAVSASPRIVNSVRAIVREEIYHWHSKVMLKEPRVGGAWEWHQDYGYWYGDGCLYPRMVSCMVALDPATRENGCLKVIVGSHQLGRLDHGQVGGQAGIDPERVAEVEQRLPIHYVAMPVGSVLFFHCNTLHASEANLSDHPRCAFICCYNALSNKPYGGKGHGKPEAIPVASDTAIMQLASAQNG